MNDEEETVSNIANWYLTHSDADGDAWSVDSREENLGEKALNPS